MMNEQIKLLADEARKHFPKTEMSGEFWVFDEEKFAELIVQECAKRAEAYAYMSPNFNALAEELRRMIGVEE